MPCNKSNQGLDTEEPRGFKRAKAGYIFVCVCVTKKNLNDFEQQEKGLAHDSRVSIK